MKLTDRVDAAVVRLTIFGAIMTTLVVAGFILV